MKPTQIEALAKVMVRQGVTRLQIGDIVIERPATYVAPRAEEKDAKVSAIEKMRASREYKRYAAGAPLLVEQE